MEATAKKFRYKTVDLVASYMSQGCFMATLDIKSAYRTIPIHSGHRKFQGIKWALDHKTESYLEDTHLCFGIKSAPYIFSTISDFITRCMNRRGVS